MAKQAERLERTIPGTTHEHIELVERTTAHNYHPLPVVVAEAEGVWVTDVEGDEGGEPVWVRGHWDAEQTARAGR